MFSMKPSLIVEEIPLNADNKEVPHGNLDLLVMSKKDETPVGFLYIGDSPISVILGSSIKTDSSFDEPRSGMS